MYLETREKEKVAPDIFQSVPNFFQSGPDFSSNWTRIFSKRSCNFLFYIYSYISKWFRILVQLETIPSCCGIVFQFLKEFLYKFSWALKNHCKIVGIWLWGIWLSEKLLNFDPPCFHQIFRRMKNMKMGGSLCFHDCTHTKAFNYFSDKTWKE